MCLLLPIVTPSLKLRPAPAPNIRPGLVSGGHVKRARYERAVVSGAAMLQTLPRIELSESFRPTLEHRLFHLENENALARAAVASAVPVMTAVGMAIVLAIVAWSPTLGRSTAEVELAPIVVSGSPSRGPALAPGTGSFIPWEPALSLEKGLGTVVGSQRLALRVFSDA